MSMGLAVFQRLCEAGNALDQLRDCALPGSDTWVALTELIQAIDCCVDTLIDSTPLGEDDGT